MNKIVRRYGVKVLCMEDIDWLRAIFNKKIKIYMEQGLIETLSLARNDYRRAGKTFDIEVMFNTNYSSFFTGKEFLLFKIKFTDAVLLDEIHRPYGKEIEHSYGTKV